MTDRKNSLYPEKIYIDIRAGAGIIFFHKAFHINK